MSKRTTNSPDRAYTKITNRYDDVLTARKWWSRLYMNCIWKVDDNLVAKEVLEMLPDDFQGEILDVPVGTAVFTAEKFRNMRNAKIVGVDFSKDMLSIANERVFREKIENVGLQHGDVCKLAFENERFDAVLSMNGFHAFPASKYKSFCEIYRVLKRGGIFLGCFYVRGERRIADWIVRYVLDKKGFFTPPHFTKKEAIELLKSFYGEKVEVKNHRSILIFKCVK
ncbi:MAG: class I SAM-dependent methyltransferase [Bacteroidales bacterium]|jgi:ubiquinone/menaquinone biosynthesis C-methylase UbiE|nr:class I SAM-dependent methyltransferase [Bacteroidales bacterium]MDI9591949.1 class I SAM-dependent methyltransferase [Bacteroidota bacterium]MBP7873244.1 class I SAM-dependent methyltransferase [Bacteroidales bacterium]MCO6468828.1 class I SAM-dependent methyltransferase [Bacteroidales bacterium]MCZ2281983.1 class I SAM-dependent methyltransferase [Bacteroidales bacterium]